MIQEQFYGELGRFLYALALADGRIQEREMKKLEAAVSDALRGLCGKYSPHGEVILSRLSFKNAMRENLPAGEAERSFLDFIGKNATRIPAEDKTTALHLIHRLAEAFGGTGRRESAMEKRVHELLNPARYE